MATKVKTEVEFEEYTYIIGSTDDFETYEQLIAAHDAGNPDNRNMSSFTFEFPKVEGLDMHYFAQAYGMGCAFDNGWCQDDTLRFFFRVKK